jgi:enamine deaminase RidA (YjgF/YER057c/UK114 family)
MTYRHLPLTLGAVLLAAWPAAAAAAERETAAKGAADAAPSAVRYLPLDAPEGMSQAVVVQGAPLVHTRQLLPLDRDGKLVGEGSAEKQAEQALANLEAVLGAAGSGLDKLVRLNICALSHPAADCIRAQLGKRLEPAVRPAITTVLTPLPHRKALLAVDAVAVAGEQGKAGVLRCEAVAGDKDCADAAVLPPGGAAYLSGQPDRGGLTVGAVARSLATLRGLLEQLKLSPAEVVQVKVFLSPASAADEVLGELKRFFPGQLAPPVVFVEWIASAPVEIELIARLPALDKPGAALQLYNPPDVRPSPSFSRAALVRGRRLVYTSSLSARAAGDGAAQARDVFAQLQKVLAATGGDWRQLIKGTYCACDDEASEKFNAVRSDFFDPLRPPAASKVMVHGVGKADRTLTVDMIALGLENVSAERGTGK